MVEGIRLHDECLHVREELLAQLAALVVNIDVIVRQVDTPKLILAVPKS